MILLSLVKLQTYCAWVPDLQGYRILQIAPGGCVSAIFLHENPGLALWAIVAHLGTVLWLRINIKIDGDAREVASWSVDAIITILPVSTDSH